MTDTIKSAADATAAVGMGHAPIDAGHPIHPATVHWPIAFLTGAFTLDVLQAFTPGLFVKTNSGSLLSTVIPPLGVVSQLSHYMNAAGIAMATVSIATGLSELYGMWDAQAKQKNGWMPALKDAYLGSNEDVGARKLKTTLSHATMNDVTVGIAAYNFYKRATSSDLALPRRNAYLSAAVLPLFFYSAYLGGALVYEYAVGVQRHKPGKEVKQLQGKSQ